MDTYMAFEWVVGFEWAIGFNQASRLKQVAGFEWVAGYEWVASKEKTMPQNPEDFDDGLLTESHDKQTQF